MSSFTKPVPTQVTSRTPDDLLQRIARQLELRGVVVTIEYPGYLEIVQQGCTFHWGTANPPNWSADIYDNPQKIADGDAPSARRDASHVSVLNTDPLVITDGIRAAMNGYFAQRNKSDADTDILSLLERSQSVIEESDDADEHSDLLRELRDAIHRVRTHEGFTRFIVLDECGDLVTTYEGDEDQNRQQAIDEAEENDGKCIEMEYIALNEGDVIWPTPTDQA